jgi:quinol monooxygenase YgiN
MPVHVLVSLTPNDPSVLPDLIHIVSELQEKSRSEDGCQFYTATSFTVDGTRAFRIIEHWDSLVALEAHEKTDHFLSLVPQLAALSNIGYLRKSVSLSADVVPVAPSAKDDIYLVVYVHVSDREAFCLYADELTAASRREEGCLYYSHSPLDGETENGSNWVFVEKWMSSAALEIHRGSEHSQRLIPLLDSVSTVKLVEESREGL